MIKNIVFDMGNVILRWDPEYIASKLSDDLNEQKIIKKASKPCGERLFSAGLFFCKDLSPGCRRIPA